MTEPTEPVASNADATGSYQRIIRLKDERIKAAEREAFRLRAALREIETMPLPYHETVKAIARAALEDQKS